MKRNDDNDFNCCKNYLILKSFSNPDEDPITLYWWLLGKTNVALLAQLAERGAYSLVTPRSRVRSSHRAFRYGVVGNMIGFHPVASGSIPDIG